MRIKTYNKRKSKKHNLIKFQTSSKILKCNSSTEKIHFDIEACRTTETEDYFVFKDEIKEIKWLQIYKVSLLKVVMS